MGKNELQMSFIFVDFFIDASTPANHPSHKLTINK